MCWHRITRLLRHLSCCGCYKSQQDENPDIIIQTSEVISNRQFDLTGNLKYPIVGVVITDDGNTCSFENPFYGIDESEYPDDIDYDKVTDYNPKTGIVESI